MTLSFRKIRNLSVCSLLAIVISFNLFAYFTMRRTNSRIETSISLGQIKLIKWNSFLEAIRDSKDYLYRYHTGEEDFISPVTLLINNAITQVNDIAELEQADSQTLNASLVNDLLANLEQYEQAVNTFSVKVRDAHPHSGHDEQLEQVMLNKANRIVEISQVAVNDINYHMKQRTDSIISMNRLSQAVLLFGLALSIILTVLITLLMTKVLASLNEELQNTVQQLADTNRELQEYNQAVYHDLGEPLRKMNAFAEMLLQSLEGKLSKDDTENLNFVIEGAGRMQDTINGLITYSRVAAHELRLQNIDLNTVVDELINSDLAEAIEQTQTQIILPEPLESVVCDYLQISRVLVHMISNAIKYRHQDIKPVVTIRSSCDSDNMVRVEIQDNGIGIKQRFFTDIFNMFRRLNPREEYDSIGIGLALCTKIIQRHNGTIGVQSTYGEGSTFWFTLPQAPRNHEDDELLQSGQTRNHTSA